MNGREIAIEFTEMWKDLDIDEINSMLANNVSMDMLEFFSSYAQEFTNDCLSASLDGKLDEAPLHRGGRVITDLRRIVAGAVVDAVAAVTGICTLEHAL